MPPEEIRVDTFTDDCPCPVCGGVYDPGQFGGEKCQGYLIGTTIFCANRDRNSDFNIKKDTKSGTWPHRRNRCVCGFTHFEALPPRRAKKKRKPKRGSIRDPGPAIRHGLNDIGNTRRFVEAFKGKLVYCAEQKTWYRWNGRVWEGDKKPPRDLAASHIESLTKYLPAIEHQHRSQAKAWFAYSRRSERIAAMLELVASEPEMRVSAEQFEENPWRLVVSNGVLDLRSRKLKLLGHDPSTYPLNRAHVIYDPDARSEAWDKFVVEVMPDPKLRSFVQRACGYSLTGSTRDERFLILYGPTMTGKSTFLLALTELMGGYGVRFPIKSILVSDRQKVNWGLLRQPGKRMAVCEEVERDVEFDSTTIKPLVSGDPLALRQSRGILEFRPTCKIWVAVNDLPRARADDDPLWRRLSVVPFREQVPLMRINPLLKEQLSNRTVNGPAVLNWALAGLRAWRKNHGLGSCAAVDRATAEYRHWQDPVSLWIEECVDRSDNGNGKRMNTSEAYSHYLGWSDRKHVIPLMRAEFARQLSRRFALDLEREKKPGKGVGKPVRGWAGLKLKGDGRM